MHTETQAKKLLQADRILWFTMASGQYSYKTIRYSVFRLPSLARSPVETWGGRRRRLADQLGPSCKVGGVRQFIQKLWSIFEPPTQWSLPYKTQIWKAALHYPRCAGPWSKRLASISLCGSACRENPQSTTGVSCRQLRVKISSCWHNGRNDDIESRYS